MEISTLGVRFKPAASVTIHTDPGHDTFSGPARGTLPRLSTPQVPLQWVLPVKGALHLYGHGRLRENTFARNSLSQKGVQEHPRNKGKELPAMVLPNRQRDSNISWLPTVYISRHTATKTRKFLLLSVSLCPQHHVVGCGQSEYNIPA